MMYVLINGCSYVRGWQFQSLDLPTVNISHYGGSNPRSIRTTLDHIITEPDQPVLAIISLTFAHRYEYWSDQGLIDIWGSGNTAPDQELRQALDIFTNRRSYPQILDDLINHIALLQMVFRARRIPYLIFNQCNRFTEQDLDPKTRSKLDKLRQDSRCLDPTRFIANDFLYQQGTASTDPDTIEPTYRHYCTDQFRPLEEYLLGYL